MVTIGEEREHFRYDVIRDKPVEKEKSQTPYIVIAIVIVLILLITAGLAIGSSVIIHRSRVEQMRKSTERVEEELERWEGK